MHQDMCIFARNIFIAPLGLLLGGLPALAAVVSVRRLDGSDCGAVSCTAAHIVCEGVLLLRSLLVGGQHLDLPWCHCLHPASQIRYHTPVPVMVRKIW